MTCMHLLYPKGATMALRIVLVSLACHPQLSHDMLCHVTLSSFLTNQIKQTIVLFPCVLGFPFCCC